MFCLLDSLLLLLLDQVFRHITIIQFLFKVLVAFNFAQDSRAALTLLHNIMTHIDVALGLAIKVMLVSNVVDIAARLI